MTAKQSYLDRCMDSRGYVTVQLAVKLPGRRVTAMKKDDRNNKKYWSEQDGAV